MGPADITANVAFRPAESRDFDRVVALEAASYPPDEAASPERIAYRLRNAPELFMVGTASVEGQDTIVSFVNATRVKGELTEESMAHHDPEGENVCIHSVVVEAPYRRQGIALRALRAYIERLRTDPRVHGVERVTLIAKERMVGLYAKAGFEIVGPSDVVHGKEKWVDMIMRM